MALGGLSIPLKEKPKEPVAPLFSDKDIESWVETGKQINSDIMCLLVGEPKTCKTGIALSCRTPEDIAAGKKIFYLELNHDNGGKINKRVFYNDDPNLITLDITVLKMDEETGDEVVDYQQSMAKLKAFLKWLNANKEKLNVKALVLDGADRLLSEYAERQMRLEQNIDVTGAVSMKYWMIRNRHFNDIMDRFIEIDVDRYIISHPKVDRDTGKVSYGVQKDFPDRCHQIAETRYDPKTNKYFIKVIADRRDRQELLNKDICVMETGLDGKKIWHGFKL
jgi:hypothetical protein